MIVPLLALAAVAFHHSGCDGLAALRKVEPSTKGGVVTIEKLKKGPMAAPWFLLQMKKDDGTKQTFAVALDDAMASPSWEQGGTFRNEFQHPAMVDPKFWESAELRCSAASPYRVTMIREGITYKNGSDASVAAAVRTITTALSTKGFGSPGVCDVALIGPDLYPAIKDDAALKIVESPIMNTFDAATMKQRSMLRVKGKKECTALGEALRRYLGASPPRVRAATAAELARHWLNIGWDVEEPLLVLDYGAHRIVLDLNGNAIFMIDELPPSTSTSSPAPPPSAHAAPAPNSH